MERKIIPTSGELAEWYNEKYRQMGDGWATPAEECNRHLDALEVPFDFSKRLLDVGCGAGHFLAEAQKRVSCTGIDISAVVVGMALKRASESTLAVYSIEDLDVILPFDYITAMGSLEHVVDLETALDKIREALKPEGRWYFFCPNDKWKHEDQPNERTFTNQQWITLFAGHGLITERTDDWNDSTAFMGVKA